MTSVSSLYLFSSSQSKPVCREMFKNVVVASKSKGVQMNHLLAQHTNRSRCWRRTALSNSGSASSLSPIRRSWNTDDLALSSNSLSSVFSLCGEARPNQAGTKSSDGGAGEPKPSCCLPCGWPPSGPAIRAAPRPCASCRARRTCGATRWPRTGCSAPPPPPRAPSWPPWRGRSCPSSSLCSSSSRPPPPPWASSSPWPGARGGREGEWGRRPLGFMGVCEATPSNPQGAAQQKQEVQGRPFCKLLGLLFCQGPCKQALLGRSALH